MPRLCPVLRGLFPKDRYAADRDTRRSEHGGVDKCRTLTPKTGWQHDDGFQMLCCQEVPNVICCIETDGLYVLYGNELDFLKPSQPCHYLCDALGHCTRHFVIRHRYWDEYSRSNFCLLECCGTLKDEIIRIEVFLTTRRHCADSVPYTTSSGLFSQSRIPVSATQWEFQTKELKTAVSTWFSMTPCDKRSAASTVICLAVHCVFSRWLVYRSKTYINISAALVAFVLHGSSQLRV